MNQKLKSVKNCLDTLVRFAYEKTQWGPRELARSIGIGKSTTLRILQTLESEQYLIRVPETGKYDIGPNMWRLGIALYRKIDLVAIGRPLVEKFIKEVNETMLIYTHSDYKIIMLAEVECSHSLRYHVTLGVPYEIHLGASGKTILANLPPEDLKKVLHDINTNSSVEVETLIQELKSVKQLGYSFSDSERSNGVIGFSSAIKGPDNSLLGGLGVMIPKARYKSKEHDMYAKFIRRCAADISSALYAEKGKYSSISNLKALTQHNDKESA